MVVLIEEPADVIITSWQLMHTPQHQHPSPPKVVGGSIDTYPYTFSEEHSPREGGALLSGRDQ